MFHSHIHILHCSYGIFDDFVNMGAIAMTGFFMLSGYSIQLSSGKKDMIDKSEIKKFYIKRLIGIFPLYYAYASINIVISIISNGEIAALQELALFPIEFLGIQSFFSSLFSYSHNGGSWFISCILVCYLIYPLIHLLTKNISDRNKLWIIAMLAFVLLYSSLVAMIFKRVNNIYSNPCFRLLEFSIGVLLCQLNAENSNMRIVLFLRKSVICIISIVLMILGITIASRIGVPKNYMLYSWVALPCFMAMIISLGYYKFRKLQSSRAIRYISSMTFTLFLSQLLVIWPLTKKIVEYLNCDYNCMRIVISFSLCCAIAYLLHTLVEIPSSKYLKSKFLKI